MTATVSDGPRSSASHGRWELDRLGHDSWRICDPARRQADADCLIAYVDRHPSGVLDVLWLRTPCPRTTRFRDFDRLFEALDLAVANASDRSRAPSPIRHRPPPRERPSL